MSKKEFGEVIYVMKDRVVEYKVRLPQGEIVIVPNSLIKPNRTDSLPIGTRLVVSHHLGIVLEATTELSISQQGTICGISLENNIPNYQIELETGKIVKVNKNRVQLHPTERNLVIGAVLEINFDNTGIVSCQPFSEKDTVSVSQKNPVKNIVTIIGKHVGEYKLRLAPEVIAKTKVGEELNLEIIYSTEGKRKFSLSYIEKIKPKKRQAQNQQSSEATKPKSTPTSTSKIPIPHKETIEAETIGIDSQLLEQIKRNQHRFEIVAFLEKHSRDGLINWYDLKPAKTARFQQPIYPINPIIQKAIGGTLSEFQGFYKHQALALDTIRENQNLVIVTQTASGKTLSYNPAIFEYLLSNPNGHVLYIFPLNALMLDQLDKVNQLIEALATQGIKINVAHLRGGMTPEERDSAARICPNIVVSNPEMLNFILDRADGVWGNFFKGLKIIVVDEVHSYRGIFGVHMTGIVRRLLYTAHRLGADPRFIVSSATVNNPLDLASRLTSIDEKEFILLDADQDGSQQAAKHWMVLNSDWGSRDTKYNNYQEVAADVFVEMLLSRDANNKSSPLTTILFCRSMREVHAIKNLVDQRLNQKASYLKSKIKAYISASLTNEVKLEIYEGLKSGNLIGVISTNALEAGIDIGSLDACVIAGFPYSVMAIRQMAGRVGRKEEGVVFFIPYPLSSLDQYYYDHPELLLTQPPEEFVVDPLNRYIARKHINATAFPKGISNNDLKKYWGNRAVEIAKQAQLDGVMRLQKEEWIGTKRDYRKENDVYQVGNIRSNIQRPFVICKTGSKNCSLKSECFDQNKKSCADRITILDQQYVYRDCHPCAIYEVPDQGLFRIDVLDDKKRVVKATKINDDSLTRTYVEADIAIEFSNSPRAHKTIAKGIEMAWGDSKVTRIFSGFFQYNLIPSRRCRRCRKEFDDSVDICPVCHRSTEHFYNRSKPERNDFPDPYHQGFKIELNTSACWLTIQPEVESLLMETSPCKLPGGQNRVLTWLKNPFDIKTFPVRLQITKQEIDWIDAFYKQSSQLVNETHVTSRETLVFPGIYSQCLISYLRERVPESRALELFQGITNYPVTDDLRHICRDCQRSVLLPAMHTLEHAVNARYPSVALGDRSDIGAFTTLGHSVTKLPTIFWFDNYDGGLGASEKIFELFLRLLETGLNSLETCSCTTIEGCPRCTFIPDCGEGNDNLSKPAGIQLIKKILNRANHTNFPPFIYQKKREEDFNKAYHANETIGYDHGIENESVIQKTQMDPYQLLRLQNKVHAIVVDKAFEVRSREIMDETPPITAEQLNTAYQSISNGVVLKDWSITSNLTPYEILEILPSASKKMILNIFRLISLIYHPDVNPERVAWATEMMKQLNAAYDQVIKEKID